MKLIFFICLLLTSSTVLAQVELCLQVANSQGNQDRPLTPAPECAEIVRSHSEKIEATSSDKTIHAYGIGHMIYVEAATTRKLLAGDQTKLTKILGISLNQSKKRMLVWQKDSISTFRLDIVGNVTPINFFKSSIVKNASSAKLLDNQDMIVIFSQGKIRIINSDAETRHKDERYKPKLLNEISGENSQLNNPTDLVINSSEKKIYVLDSNRLLVFPANVKKDQAPLKIIKLDEARSLTQKENLIFYVNTKGQETQILKNN